MFALLTSSPLLAVVAAIVGQDLHANPVQHIRMKLPSGAPEPQDTTSWAASWRKARAHLAASSDCATRMRRLRRTE
jgi:hypothetical protein